MEITNIERDSDGKLPAFAWPGGYPIYYLDKSCSVMCADCATKALDSEYGDGFAPVASDIHWEGDSLICEDCNKEIESAYGNPDQD